MAILALQATALAQNRTLSEFGGLWTTGWVVVP